MVYIHLYHGRKDPDEQLDDWGEDGPALGPFSCVHGTYFSTLRAVLLDGEGHDWFLTNNPNGEDMVYYDGMWYGDFTVMSEPESDHDVQPFDREKTKQKG